MTLLPGIPDIEYHKDAALSASGAKTLLDCPARYRWEREHPRKPKREYDIGHLAHRITLGEGADIAVLDPAVHGLKADGNQSDNPRQTALWKRAEAEARERGAVPVSVQDWQAAVAMHSSVMKHDVACELFTAAHGLAERSGWWVDAETSVQLRFRPDWLCQYEGEPVCVDLKTANSADPAEFQRAVHRFKYHLQAAWYQAGLDALDMPVKRTLFVVVEVDPPHPVSVIELDTEAMDEGRRLMRRAIDTYQQCMETGVWPGYGDDITLIGLPAWAIEETEIAV